MNVTRDLQIDTADRMNAQRSLALLRNHAMDREICDHFMAVGNRQPELKQRIGEQFGAFLLKLCTKSA